jgi:phage FluMu gp28-like protein
MSESLIKLHPYEQRWLADKSRWKIGMFARQTGKSFTTGLEIVENVLEAEARGETSSWVWFSRGQRQSRLAMDESIKPHLSLYRAAFKAMETVWGRDEDGEIIHALDVTFPHGSRITAIPANPDTARGYTRNVVLDEFAIHKDSRAVWGALMPVVSRPDLKMRIISTPKGKGNKFYELMTGGDKTWSRHTCDIYQAVREGLNRNVDELRAALGDQDLWEQEFELKWLDEASAWLPYDLIFACEDPQAGLPDLYRGGLCFVGNDIAVRRDLWVMWVLELIGDVLWTREVRTLRRASFAEQDAVMDEIMKRYRVTQLWMDQTSIGEKPVEDAIRRYGASRVTGVQFSNASKLDIAVAGKSRFEDRKLRIPEGDVALRGDLHKPKRVVGPTGLARFVAEHDEEGHADRFWALMLACGAANIAPREYAYTPGIAPAGRGFSNEDPSARDAYEDSLAGGRGWMRERLGRFARGTW